MGHGKETPRQKMIGMMYLVLTALLALNVSAEVLNAFIRIDRSIRKTTTNFVKKNDETYTAFEKAYLQNKNLVGPWKEKAGKVKEESDKMVKVIQDLKELIITTADGDNMKQPQNKDKAPEETILKKDDNNVPGQIMILNKKGEELKKEVDKYRDFLLSLIKDTTKARGTVTGIKTSLSTSPIYNEEEKKEVPWEAATFEHLPLVGVTTLMSKMQSDVRNAEAEILGYLFSQIEVGAFKFNKIEAIVNSPTNYVLVGNKYEAQVFIAASDSTQAPVIEVGGSKLPVNQGKGIYSGATSSPGLKQWGGVIKIKKPGTEDIIEYPFKSEYQVAVADISVSPTKMNVFYIGVPNPVEITAAGTPSDKLRPACSGAGGVITKNGNEWVVNVRSQGECVISVSAEIDKQTRSLGTRKFRVKRIPDPIAKVGDKAGGSISKSELQNQSIVKAVLENFDFDAKFTVTSFVVSAVIKGFTEDQKSNSSSFTAAQKNLIRQMEPGKKIYIDDIMAVGPDGSSRRLPSIIFKIQ